MQLIRREIVLLAVLGGSCFAGIIIETPKRTTSFIASLINATVKVLTSCYGADVNTVNIHGDSTGMIFKALLSKLTCPVVLTGKTTKAKHSDIVGRYKLQPLYKLQVFTVVANSSIQLDKILKELQSSPWWNHIAFFLILDWPIASNHECSNASDFLYTAWKMNLLHANFLCVHRTKGILLYTFNPYTNEAPTPWRLANTFKENVSHPWSMFVRGYREDEDICENLDFDKTKALRGYGIHSLVLQMGRFWKINLNKTGIDGFEGLEGEIAQIFIRAMNVTVKLLTYSEKMSPLLIDTIIKMGTGPCLDVENGRSDIMLNSWNWEYTINKTISYPFWFTGINAITQSKGHVSVLNKIKSVIDVHSRYTLYFVILITPICFKYFFHQGLMSAILDTARIISNSCLTKPPKNAAAKIYLATLSFFQITILALYQDQLASLLTKPVYREEIDTIEDLEGYNYSIYAHKSFKVWFPKEDRSIRFIEVDTIDCKKYVWGDSKGACIEKVDITSVVDIPPNLHITRKPILTTYLVYVMRKDWPLEQKFQDILRRMVEADLIKYTASKYTEGALLVSKYHTKQVPEVNFRAITFSDIHFAFKILEIGLGCATVAFVVDHLIGKFE